PPARLGATPATPAHTPPGPPPPTHPGASTPTPPPTTPPSKPPPRRWVVERTLAWISSYRRCARDYERLPASHEATVYWAMITVMTRPASPERDPGRSGAGRLGPGCHTTGDGSTARTRQLGVLHWGGGAAAVLDVAPEYEFIVVGAGTAGVCWRPGCHRTPEPGCWCWRRGSKRGATPGDDGAERLAAEPGFGGGLGKPDHRAGRCRARGLSAGPGGGRGGGDPRAGATLAQSG